MYAALEIAKKLAVRAIVAHVGAALVVDHGDKKISYEKWTIIKGKYIGMIEYHIKSATLISQSLEQSDYDAIFKFIFSEIEKRFVAPPVKEKKAVIKSSFYDNCVSLIRSKNEGKPGIMRSFKFVTDESANESTAAKSNSVYNIAISDLIRDAFIEHERRIFDGLSASNSKIAVINYETISESPSKDKTSLVDPITKVCVEIDVRYCNGMSSGQNFLFFDLQASFPEDQRVQLHAQSFSFSYMNHHLKVYRDKFRAKFDQLFDPDGKLKSKSIYGKSLELLFNICEEDFLDTISMFNDRDSFSMEEELKANCELLKKACIEDQFKQTIYDRIRSHSISSWLDVIIEHQVLNPSEKQLDIIKYILYPSLLVFEKPILLHLVINFKDVKKDQWRMAIIKDATTGASSLEGLSDIPSVFTEPPEDIITVLYEDIHNFDEFFLNGLANTPKTSVSSFFSTRFYFLFTNGLSLSRTKAIKLSNFTKTCLYSSYKPFSTRFDGKALPDFKALLDSLGPAASVLIAGKPGTGKTLLCNTLSEDGITLNISNKSFEYLDESTLGKLITIYTPQYIIIDDISECDPRVFGKVLNMLDRLNSSHGRGYTSVGLKLRIIMTCNNPDVIPENFKRPGRISLFIDFDEFINSDDQYQLDGVNSIIKNYKGCANLPKEKIEILKDMYSATSVSYVEQLCARIENCGHNYKLQDWDIHWKDLDTEIKRKWNDLCN